MNATDFVVAGTAGLTEIRNPQVLPGPAAAVGTLGTLADLVRLMGAAPADGARALESMRIPLRRLHEGSTLIFEGARGHAIYVLRCGSVKTVKVQEDGYEQVLSFQQAGDVVGFEGLHGAVLPASVVALEESSVYVLPFAELPQLRDLCPVFTDALELALSRQLLNAAAPAALMAAVASEARLARFLLWWSERMAAAGRSPRKLHLRMCRRDIASFLGVAHATVSRSFTALAEAACLRVDNRDVEILDFEALHVRARNTRGLSPDHAEGSGAHAHLLTAWHAGV
ncbi:MAG: Crp/Fnr family transcriptional regulator [Rubrivivax sp.]|nr:Crp/Fnr family transcriptional regulator [Rubrivivax sp.]